MTDLHKRLMHHAWYGGQTEIFDLNPGVDGVRVHLSVRVALVEIVPHEILNDDEKPFLQYALSRVVRLSVPLLEPIRHGSSEFEDGKMEARRILQAVTTSPWFFDYQPPGTDVPSLMGVDSGPFERPFIPILAFRPVVKLAARDLQSLEGALAGAGIESVEGLSANELSDLVGGYVEMKTDLESATIVLEWDNFLPGVMAMWRDGWFFSSMDLWTEKGLDMYGDSLDEYFDVERLRKISVRDLEDLAGDSPALWQRRLQEMATKTGAIVQLNLPFIRVEPEF